MDKLSYLLESFNHRAYTKKAYLLSILSIINDGQEDKLKNIPYACHRDWKNNQCYFIRPDTGEKIILDSTVPNKPLFVKNEPITINAIDSNFIKEDIETTIGRFIFNVIVLFEAFKGKVDYINEPIDGNKLREIIRDLMVDNPSGEEEIPENKASVNECLKVTQQMDYLEGLNPVLVKASSIDVFTIHPEIIKLRNKLLKDLEEKELLNDPVAVAGVIDQLVEKDAEIQYNGPSRDLFIKKSFITDSRKKMFIVFGMEPGFHDNKYELLRNSLNEGWELDKFSAYVNTAIDASYSRSISVALAGADIKTVILLTGKIKAIKNDCKTIRTEPVTLSKLNFKGWIGSYYVSDNKLFKIEENDFDKLNGKNVGMRVPQYCKEPGGNLCNICCGEKLGKHGQRISSEVSLFLTKFFLLEMKAMHTSSLKTKLLDLENMLR